MRVPQPTANSGKAAVLVIDNETGFFGLSPETMNDLGKDLFGQLLQRHYDSVVVVVAHKRAPLDNEVVAALKTATSQFGTVDMFVNMHTNMDNNDLAQVPLEAFMNGLSESEKAHLRVLYTMGCGDGNQTSATAASQLGFKTFVGHVGTPSASPIFAYPFLVRWLGSGVPIADAANTVFADISSCAPVMANKLAWNWNSVIKVIELATGKCAGLPLEGLGKCIVDGAGQQLDPFFEIAGDLTKCLPEAGIDLTGIIDGTASWTPPDEIAMARKLEPFSARIFLQLAVNQALSATRPFISGDDIKFN